MAIFETGEFSVDFPPVHMLELTDCVMKPPYVASLWTYLPANLIMDSLSIRRD